MGPVRTHLMAAAVVLGVSFGAVQSTSGCEPGPASGLLRAADAPRVTAVVEHWFLAANPLPWGRSVFVVTRVWGGARVERWDVSDRRSHHCPDVPPLGAGMFMYTFPGSGTAEVVGDEPVGGLDAAALQARFGPPTVYPVSAVDRAMAWVRIAPAWIVGSVALIGAIVVAWVRRRRRGRDPYLF